MAEQDGGRPPVSDLRLGRSLPKMNIIPYKVADPALIEARPSDLLEGVRSYQNVVVGERSGWRPLRADVHVPSTVSGPAPAVVYAHGGAFVGGVKEMGPWLGLLRHGIAVVSVEYRLAGEVTYPGPVEDILTAQCWIRSHGGAFGLDTRRIASWGSSAGGFLVARAALSDGVSGAEQIDGTEDSTPEVDAVVLHYAPTDLVEDLAAVQASAELSTRLDVMTRLMFDMRVDDAQLPAVLEHASVMAAASRANRVPPFFIAHGDSDRTVELSQSVRLQRTLRHLGVHCELHVIEGEDHASEAFARPPAVDAVAAFLHDVWSGRLAQRAGGFL